MRIPVKCASCGADLSYPASTVDIATGNGGKGYGHASDGGKLVVERLNGDAGGGTSVSCRSCDKKV